MKTRGETVVRLVAMLALLAGSVTFAGPGEPDARKDPPPQQVLSVKGPIGNAPTQEFGE